MNAAHNVIRNAKIGSIVPVVEEMPHALQPVEYFAKLSDYGNKKNSILFESADVIPKYGEKSLGSADPCLKVTGQSENFEVTALSKVGVRFIEFLKHDFGFCDEVEYRKGRIIGKLKPKRKNVSEEERLKLANHMDIIRKIAFKFRPTLKPFVPYAGLFGCISYDFIDQFEDLPKNKADAINDPDYLFYFLDNLFLIDHKKNNTFFVSNALVTDGGSNIYDECVSKIDSYKKAMGKIIPKIKSNAAKNNHKQSQKTETDTSKEEFTEIVTKIKEHIKAGDVFQAVLSRTISLDFNKDALKVYKKLRELNPSPYMFYINSESGIFLGASPEMSLRVQGDDKKIAEIRPIAGTKPRGLKNNKIDADLDSRYESELKIDAKEISEHIMLVDLARNDVAKISEPGTRYVDEPFVIEKYSHVQHLVSNVKGVLKGGLDALHAYIASMNMGTLTGAPKVEAMKLLRIYEKTKRGFYGGAVGYVTPSGDLDSTIAIRSIRIKGNRACIRAGAGIVYDSDPESEFIETERKAYACLKAIELAGD
ncbi:anthranilate synthase component 1 [Candidatus Woesearchaeota archaeon]|nr:anthranilate synthase component 1 [Candidatus Woesearchaeota archaeon]